MKNGLDLVIEQPISIRERVYTSIKERILSGRFDPSQRLVETQIAQQLGVSRTPVREALHVLEMEGLLESIPRTGYKIKEILWEEVEEICEIRKVTETLAARWAMQRITPRELSELEENLRVAAREVEEGFPEKFVDKDADFHEKLVRASGSRRLIEICQSLRRHMLLYRIESIHEPPSAINAIAGHRDILDRLRARDEAGVGEAIDAHLESVKRDIRDNAFANKPDKP